MHTNFDDELDEERDEDDLGFSKTKKSAVLEADEENGEVVVADPNDFESADLGDEEEVLDGGFSLNEHEDDDLGLQF